MQSQDRTPWVYSGMNESSGGMLWAYGDHYHWAQRLSFALSCGLGLHIPPSDTETRRLC
jgi:hypothetical protein